MLLRYHFKRVDRACGLSSRLKRSSAMTKLARRDFLRATGAAIVSPALSRIALAQDYPARPIRLLVGNTPGGGPDIAARLVGPWLSERLGQPVVIENRPGAAGNVATEAVVNAPADGHTLLVVTSSSATSEALFEKLNFNFLRDIAPVASINRDPLFLLVHPSFPARTVPEFIAYAKANPGKVNMASPGSGTTPHIAGELFNMMAGIRMVHVPYRSGAPALTDVISGHVQVFFGALPPSIEHIRAGRLRPLAVTSTTRSEMLPEIPTVHDLLPGFEASAWFGIGAPRQTPARIVDRLNKEINAGLADARLKARLAQLGSLAFVGSPADFEKFIADETEKWTKVVRFAGIKAE
jgi:tripartite-type tricarboxylate transporter receptor subunit TctC